MKRFALFHKESQHCKWFYEGEDTTGYTEKTPPNINAVWSEEEGKWILLPQDLEIVGEESIEYEIGSGLDELVDEGVY